MQPQGFLALQVCGAIFRMDAGQPEGGPGVDYILKHKDILNSLFRGWATSTRIMTAN